MNDMPDWDELTDVRYEESLSSPQLDFEDDEWLARQESLFGRIQQLMDIQGLDRSEAEDVLRLRELKGAA